MSLVEVFNIRVKKLHPYASLPAYSNGDENNAGLDFSAVESFKLKAGEVTKVPTGIAVDFSQDNDEAYFPVRKFYMKLESRSGLASKGIFVVGGVIDQNYRGEIIVLLYNSTNQDYLIEKGNRIAQGIIIQTIYAQVKEVPELTDTIRGTGGFGSTGK